MRMRNLLLVAAVTGSCFFAAPKARALDPVTIAILAPAAMRMAEATRPYVMQGLMCGARGLAKTGISAFKVMLLPWGIVQCTAGFPIGGLGPGINNVIEGGMAPFEMAFHAAMLPVNLFGVDI